MAPTPSGISTFTVGGTKFEVETGLLAHWGRDDPIDGEVIYRDAEAFSTLLKFMYRGRVDGVVTIGQWLGEEARAYGLNRLAEALENRLTAQDVRHLVQQGALNFIGYNLRHLDLRGADLSGCDFTAASLQDSNLRGCRISGAKLVGANLSGSDLRDVKFIDCDLSDARLLNCQLNGASFAQAKLARCDMSGSILDGATLVGADTDHFLWNGQSLDSIDAETPLPFKRSIPAFSGSRILSAEQIKALQAHFADKRVSNCLYSGYRHGLTDGAGEFHKRCDNKGATLVVCKRGEYVFGGYCSQSWDGSQGFRGQEVDEAWIFTFGQSGKKLLRLKSHSTPMINQNAADGGGPCWGRFDLQIGSGIDFTSDCRVIVDSYIIDADANSWVDVSASTLAGKQQFGVEDIEVWQVQGSDDGAAAAAAAAGDNSVASSSSN